MKTVNPIITIIKKKLKNGNTAFTNGEGII